MLLSGFIFLSDYLAVAERQPHKAKYIRQVGLVNQGIMTPELELPLGALQ